MSSPVATAASSRCAFRERDGKPSAYTRLYAQGVDLMVHKDQVYQQFGLHKSPPPPSLQGGAKAKLASPSAVTSSSSFSSASQRHSVSQSLHPTSAAHAKPAAAGHTPRKTLARTHSASNLQSASTRASLKKSQSDRGRAATAPSAQRVSASSSSSSSRRPASPLKPQRRQSVIATQLLNKSLRISPAVVHPATAALVSGAHASASASTPEGAGRSPRLSIAANATGTRRQSYQIQVPRASMAMRPGTVSKRESVVATSPPRASSDPYGFHKQQQQQPQQTPVLVPVSRRTSSPIVAPNGGADFGMIRRPSVSPIRSDDAQQQQQQQMMMMNGSSNASLSRPVMHRRDSKVDRLVEQITVLKHSLGLSDEDLQWKVESTKGNAFLAAERHLTGRRGALRPTRVRDSATVRDAVRRGERCARQAAARVDPADDAAGGAQADARGVPTGRRSLQA
ncbi:hypothetical protein PINS_up014771 [Pythium insidiosum]|nr:hypothetical protein PINS_up014771 [Pythium insidiosum]